MFCGKCGKEVAAGATFCGNCGAPIEKKSSSISFEKSSCFDDEKYNRGVKNKKSGVKKVLGILVIVIVVALLIIPLKNRNSAENVAIKACKATVEGDMDTYYKVLAPDYIDYMVGSDGWYSTYDEFKEDLLDYANDHREDIEYECGKNFKIKYSAEVEEECDADMITQVQYELYHDYGYDEESVKAAKLIKVSMDVSGSDRETTYSTIIACVKIGTKWYVHRPGLSSLQ